VPLDHFEEVGVELLGRSHGGWKKNKNR
jgi:hypothetical protein